MIAWFTRNSVAASLLMVLVIAVGLYSVQERVILEIFPEFESERVQVQMSYRGATPSEIEEGLLIKIEEAVQDLVGIKELSSSASEGSGTVTLECERGVNPRELLEDVKGRVDTINTFPDEAERPTFSIPVRRREVIGLIVSGDLPERQLRAVGERVQNELLALPEITQVDLTEVRPYEIALEVSEEALEAHGLTFDEVAAAITRSSLDLPAGSLKTSGGEIRLRTRGQSYTGEDFARLTILQGADGARVSLGELAEIRDGFEEEPIEARFNGERCVVLEIYRVGDQNAIEVARAARDYAARAKLPPGVSISYWRDRSEYIKKRLNSLYTNAAQGAILVAIVLGLFLRPSIAFWVCMGIPVSFLGALAVMPSLGVTINLLSLFAFIVVLGIVVDDAIVTGENIYTHISRGGDPTEATIRATEEVAGPVTIGALTTVLAFVPLAFMAGRRGSFFSQIPLVIVPVLMFSLLESKFVLPAHLKNLRVASEGDSWLLRMQGTIAGSMVAFARRFYRPLLVRAVWARYLTLAIFTAGLTIVSALVGSGATRFIFFPRVQSEEARASLTMPEGTSFELTASYVDRISKAAIKLREETRDPATGESVIQDILATAGSSGSRSGQPHIGRVTFELSPPEERGIKLTTGEVVQRWRELIGPIPGARSFQFRAETGRGGDPIHVSFSGTDLGAMETAMEATKKELEKYDGVFDITDSFQEGKPELTLRLRPEAETLGLTQQDLARQVRQGFFGADVQRVQRGRDDVRVTLRYPQEERGSLGYLEAMKVRTAAGAAVPFADVAEVKRGLGFATIIRRDRERILDVTADIDKKTVDAQALAEDLRVFLDDYLADKPEIRYQFKGEMEEKKETFDSLAIGLGFILFAIYILLAIPFRSYVQPLVVMSVIPFGWAGAVVGHQIMGLDLSIFSVLGILALTGVVVNDSLVMLDFINRARSTDGMSLMDAVHESGVARFRAIILTSLTTFAGLVPLMFEKSTQAQFLIPMGVSLGFGVVFATVVTLFLVPVCYVIMEDGLAGLRGLRHWLWDSWDPEEEAP